MISLLLFGAIGLLLLSAVVAPLESLSWWAGWTEPPKRAPLKTSPASASAPSTAKHFLVYLSGIGAIASNSIPQEELPFLEELTRRLPGTQLVTDVFPYSVTNLGLTGQRTTAAIWQRLEKMRLGNPNTVGALLVNLRNALQLFVSADRRYGPVYNYGVATEIWYKLEENGYRAGSGTPITLLGWSGGGQIALGAANYLKGMTNAPIRVISLGGLLSDDHGLAKIDDLWHLYGEKDPLQALGGMMYAGRWPVMPHSPWNRAQAKGVIKQIALGPHKHNGQGNYFDFETQLDDGRRYGEKTLDTIEDCLISVGLEDKRG